MPEDRDPEREGQARALAGCLVLMIAAAILAVVVWAAVALIGRALG